MRFAGRLEAMSCSGLARNGFNVHQRDGLCEKYGVTAETDISDKVSAECDLDLVFITLTRHIPSFSVLPKSLSVVVNAASSIDGSLSKSLFLSSRPLVLSHLGRTGCSWLRILLALSDRRFVHGKLSGSL